MSIGGFARRRFGTAKIFTGILFTTTALVPIQVRAQAEEPICDVVVRQGCLFLQDRQIRQFGTIPPSVGTLRNRASDLGTITDENDDELTRNVAIVDFNGADDELGAEIW